LGFVASLILYLIYKDKGPFVRENAANYLNLQITTGIVLLVSIPLMLVLVGFITFAAAIVVAFVLHLIGAPQGQPRRVVAAAADAALRPLTLSMHPSPHSWVRRSASTGATAARE
jgi:hypothetical protein